MPVTVVTDNNRLTLDEFGVKEGDLVFVEATGIHSGGRLLHTRNVLVRYPNNSSDDLECRWYTHEVRKPTELEIVEAKLLGEI